MIHPLEADDFDELSNLVAIAVRENVASNAEEAHFLTEDIILSLKTWQTSERAGFHAKDVIDDAIVGFVVVKDYWNLSHLFVLPHRQRQGVGRRLIKAAIEVCRDRSPRGKIQLYASAYAAPFYAAMGFHQTGPEIKRPGGCIPLEYDFAASS